MSTRKLLRLNWIEGRPGLSGGIKSNKLIAEAMQRRGHIVTTTFLPPSRPWPPPWRLRGFYRRMLRALDPQPYSHHLQQSAVALNQMPGWKLDPHLVPDADVTFASWWDVWRQVHAWPASKGLKVHYVRHYEIHAAHADDEEVNDAYRLPAPRVVISNWLGRIVEELGNQEIARVPNGVDWTQFNSMPRDKPRRPTVGLLMHPTPFKDTPTGIRAIVRLLDRYPDLRVIGFGPQPLPRGWTIPQCVEFYRDPLQSVIPEIYQQASCWIISSSAEGFGMPGIEAMASHCPIVSTRCGGPEDFVREGVNGHLVDVGDDEAMADRIARVLDLDAGSWCKMSEASYHIAREFDWDQSAEILEAAIYRWLDNPRPEWGPSAS